MNTKKISLINNKYATNPNYFALFFSYIKNKKKQKKTKKKNKELKKQKIKW